MKRLMIIGLILLCTLPVLLVQTILNIVHEDVDGLFADEQATLAPYTYTFVRIPRAGDVVYDDFSVISYVGTRGDKVQWELLDENGNVLSDGVVNRPDEPTVLTDKVSYEIDKNQVGSLVIYDILVDGENITRKVSSVIPLILKTKKDNG